jgi:hypothetical protein
MTRKIALLAALLLVLGALSTAAQQPNATEPATSAAPAQNPPAPRAEAVPAQPSPAPSMAPPAGIQGGGFPSKFTIDFVKPADSGTGSGPIIVALIALAGAAVTAWVTYFNGKRTTAMQKQLTDQKQHHDERLAELNRTHMAWQAELQRQHVTTEAEVQRKYEALKAVQTRDFTKTLEDRKSTLEEKRVQIEYEKMLRDTSASTVESWTASRKFVHDKQAEEAKLIHLFFDKLVSKQQAERDLALFTLSSFVDSTVIERLALAGDSPAWRASLSRLAARGEDGAAAAAQKALNADATDYQNSVVCVRVGKDAPVTATGFFCEPSLLITCIDAKQDQVIFVQSKPDATDKQEAKCLAIDDKSRIAVAHVQTATSARPLAVRAAEYATLTDAESEKGVAALQWALNRQPRFVARAGTVGGVAPRAGEAAVTPASHQLKLNITLEQGSAGAPVLDDEGRVIAVVIGDTHEHNVSHAASAQDVEKLVQTARQRQEESKAAQQQPETASPQPQQQTAPPQQQDGSKQPVFYIPQSDYYRPG